MRQKLTYFFFEILEEWREKKNSEPNCTQLINHSQYVISIPTTVTHFFCSLKQILNPFFRKPILCKIFTFYSLGEGGGAN